MYYKKIQLVWDLFNDELATNLVGNSMFIIVYFIRLARERDNLTSASSCVLTNHTASLKSRLSHLIHTIYSFFFHPHFCLFCFGKLIKAQSTIVFYAMTSLMPSYSCIFLLVVHVNSLVFASIL